MPLARVPGPAVACWLARVSVPSVWRAGKEPGGREVGREHPEGEPLMLLPRDQLETSDRFSLEVCFLWAGPE